MLINEVGRGLVTARQKHKTIPGEAKNSKNFFHGNFEGETYDRAELRKYARKSFKRAGQINLLAEYRQDNGTKEIIVKNGSTLEVVVDEGTTPTALTGLTLTNAKSDWAQGLDKFYFTGVSGTTSPAAVLMPSGANRIQELVPVARPTSVMSLSEAGVATGFGTGEFEYNYTLYSNTFGWETRAKATSTKITKSNVNLGVRWTMPNPNDPGITGIYDRYRLYRRLQGENAWYLIATIVPSPGGTYDDVTIESTLTDAALSEIHDNETGLDDYELPPTFVSLAFYRGRLWGAYEDNVIWSKVGLPFLFRINEIGRKQIGDDGDQVVAIRIINESLVIFKKHSIWIHNGDTLEENYVFFPVTRRIGLINREAIAVCPGGCIFIASDRQVYWFDLTEDSLRKPISNLIDLDVNWTQFANFSAGYDPASRQVYLSMASSGQTNIDLTYSISLDGLAWGQIEFLKLFPSYYAIYTNLNDELKCLIGFTNGLGLQTQTSSGADGVNNSTPKAGRVEAGISTTVFTVIGANFDTVGLGLVGLPCTVEINGIKETRLIASHTATQITLDSALSEIPKHYDRVWIGGMEAILHFKDLKQTSELSKIDELNFFLNSSDVSNKWKFGATIDKETNRTRFRERSLDDRIIIPLQVRCHSIAPFLESFGTDLVMDLGGVEFEAKRLRIKS